MQCGLEIQICRKEYIISLKKSFLIVQISWLQAMPLCIFLHFSLFMWKTLSGTQYFSSICNVNNCKFLYDYYWMMDCWVLMLDSIYYRYLRNNQISRVESLCCVLSSSLESWWDKIQHSFCYVPSQDSIFSKARFLYCMYDF